MAEAEELPLEDRRRGLRGLAGTWPWLTPCGLCNPEPQPLCPHLLPAWAQYPTLISKGSPGWVLAARTGLLSFPLTDMGPSGPRPGHPHVTDALLQHHSHAGSGGQEVVSVDSMQCLPIQWLGIRKVVRVWEAGHWTPGLSTTISSGLRPSLQEGREGGTSSCICINYAPIV